VEKLLHIGKPFLVEATKKRRRGIVLAKKRHKGENGGVHWHPMMLLERWAVGTILALTIPLVATANGVFDPPQTRSTKTAHPIRNQDPDDQQPNQDALPSKTIDEQDAPYIKAAEEQDAQSPKPAASEDNPPANADDDHNVQPVKAAEDPPAPSAQPAETAQDPPAVPDPTAPTAPSAPSRQAAEAAQEQNVQPVKVVTQPPPPQPAEVKAAVPVVASPPLSPEQIKQQQKFDKDTAQLLQLVQDLKAEVEKAGSNTLSLAALRKADEIQRLVKSLKEKMKEDGQALVNKP
jgi:hypothetical protein